MTDADDVRWILTMFTDFRDNGNALLILFIALFIWCLLASDTSIRFGDKCQWREGDVDSNKK